MFTIPSTVKSPLQKPFNAVFARLKSLSFCRRLTKGGFFLSAERPCEVPPILRHATLINLKRFLVGKNSRPPPRCREQEAAPGLLF